jgi:hypothetical protein
LRNRVAQVAYVIQSGLLYRSKEFEAAQRAARQLFNVVNAIFCKLHNPCHYEVGKGGGTCPVLC